MNYDDIDFNKLYIKQKEESTFKMKSQESWDKKAASMNKKVHNSIYNDEFIKSIDLKDCKTLLDVGCGVGNLSLKLSSKLKKVYSLDYSRAMLDILSSNMKEQNISNIELINSSWQDDWKDIPQADIVIASRSMEVTNMKEALNKLNEKAKKRVYLSYKVGFSFVSDEILAVMKREIIKKPDYIYLLNILYQMGITAKVDFIRSEGRSHVYTNVEDFISSISWSIGELSLEEKKSLEEYYSNNINNIENKKEYVKWALISWDKED